MDVNSDKPRVALTLGDVAGVGPEVVARACADRRLAGWCRPLVVGDPAVLRRAAATARVELSVSQVDEPAEASWDNGGVPCWNPAGDVTGVAPGQLDARAGRAAYDCLVAATHAALSGSVDAITTAPLNKAALRLAGLDYPGHTEILAEQCGRREFAMMLYLPAGDLVAGPWGLGVAHVTLHTALRDVPGLLSTDRVNEKILLLHDALRDLGCPRPRIAVCALNPHAGEQGLFGDEESRIIQPAVDAARSRGVVVAGPLPADTLLGRAVAGDFDGVVAMYHDQGHIALKLIGFDWAVNITLGLPIVRTSPSHGTAFDIAWQGTARAEGFLEAVRVAALLAQRRRATTVLPHGNT